MATENYISLGEYLQSTEGAVLLFVLNDARGNEINRQIVTFEQLQLTTTSSYTAKFVVDELLSATMIPGTYTLYLYIGLPSSTATANPLTPADYTFDKCLTEQGIKLRVRGGALKPSVGVEE